MISELRSLFHLARPSRSSGRPSSSISLPKSASLFSVDQPASALLLFVSLIIATYLLFGLPAVRCRRGSSQSPQPPRLCISVTLLLEDVFPATPSIFHNAEQRDHSATLWQSRLWHPLGSAQAVQLTVKQIVRLVLRTSLRKLTECSKRPTLFGAYRWRLAATARPAWGPQTGDTVFSECIPNIL